MLQVISITGAHLPSSSTGQDLLAKNPSIRFLVRAPIYWWVDTDWVTYSLSLPTKNLHFCVDTWPDGSLFIEHMKDYLEHVKRLEPRQFMQILAMSIYAEGIIELTYQEIVETCENYVAGEYRYIPSYSFPNDREWKDFCETLLDIRGVRDLIKEET